MSSPTKQDVINAIHANISRSLAAIHGTNPWNIVVSAPAFDGMAPQQKRATVEAALDGVLTSGAIAAMIVTTEVPAKSTKVRGK